PCVRLTARCRPCKKKPPPASPTPTAASSRPSPTAPVRWPNSLTTSPKSSRKRAKKLTHILPDELLVKRHRCQHKSDHRDNLPHARRRDALRIMRAQIITG